MFCTGAKQELPELKHQCSMTAQTASHTSLLGSSMERMGHLKRLLAWQTHPRAVYSILNSRDISQDRLNSLSGSGVMDSMAFLTAGMKNSTCSRRPFPCAS